MRSCASRWSFWIARSTGGMPCPETRRSPGSRIRRGWAERWGCGRRPGSREPTATGATDEEGWLGNDSALQQLLGDALDVGRLDLALVRLHDVADEAPDLVGVGDAERGHALLDEGAHRRLVHTLGKVALAELLLEPETR